MMKVTNENMLNAKKILKNLYWRLNSEVKAWLITDEKEFKREWVIQYLLNVCKFTVTVSFLLLNLLLAVTENTLKTFLTKSEKNVEILEYYAELYIITKVTKNENFKKICKISDFNRSYCISNY